MGMDAGTTDGSSISAKSRLRAIGGGWDINDTSIALKHLKPRSVLAYTSTYLARLASAIIDDALHCGTGDCNH